MGNGSLVINQVIEHPSILSARIREQRTDCSSTPKKKKKKKTVCIVAEQLSTGKNQ